ncbi:MAG TPA: hypothetical protein VMZ53_21755 [Kofleriaceae bacterium]|nr:hypothetical protein [Kofleriaceae bacterium]
MIRSIAALALALALAPLAGCASDTAQAKPAPTTVQASTADDPKAVCVATMTRARECTDDYIPALVDARAQADAPPGIADAVKKDRNAVIAEAKQEWATDSQDANIAAMCDKMAGASTPDELATAKDCNAKTDCKEYTSCSMPLFAKHFRK